MKQLLLSLIYFTTVQFCLGQDSLSIQALQSRGAIPIDFRTSTLEKIHESIETDEIEGVKSKKSKKKFHELTNFGIDEILQSGQVCFGDSITNYVTKVFNEIKKANPTIPNNLRLYTVKSDIVNAYTTDQGIIFVNTGLIAKLNSEAELAFVLCHEVIHYLEKHVRETYIDEIKEKENKKNYRTVKKVDAKLSRARFSRKLEKEADKKGLQFFLNTKYNTQAVFEVFDILNYAYLGLDTIPFDSTILMVDSMRIPSKYFKSNLNKVEADENEDDAVLTHPNIASRKQAAEKILTDSTKTGNDFLVSEDEFYAVKKIAQYSVLRNQIINGNYSTALYNTNVLMHQNPNDKRLKLVVGEILFGASVFANDKRRKNLTGYYKNKQGNLQQAYYVLNKIPSKDLTLMATRFYLDLEEQHPTDPYIKNRLEDLFENLNYYYQVDSADFIYSAAQANKKNTHNKVVTKSVKVNPNSKNTTYDKDWAYKLFIDCNCQESVENYLATGKKRSDQLKYDLAETDNEKMNRKSIKENKKLEKYHSKKGYALGIDTIVILDPYYTILRMGKKESYQQYKSEKELVELAYHLPEVAQDANLHATILNNYNLDSTQTQAFNDYALLSEWVNERFEFEDRSKTISLSEEIQDLKKRYNTKYFGWTGVVSLKSPRPYKRSVFLLSLITVYGIPFGIYYIATPMKETSIFFVLFNIETGKLVYAENRTIPFNDTNIALKTAYYNIFHQLKASKFKPHVH